MWPKMNFLNPDELVQGHIILNDSKAKSRRKEVANGCVRANACQKIWWDPADVRAAIIICGGLCPGLNSIIREITYCLWFQYGVRNIVGVHSGYSGLSHPEGSAPAVHLGPRLTHGIHMKGGSILQVGCGGSEVDVERTCDNLKKMGVNMLFVVGGDGAHAAGDLVFQEARRRNMRLSIVGVPKSIDNDLLFFDKTFGFDTAVGAACGVINNGWVEATSCDKGVGIVKLMGRDSGFICMDAALSSNIVDLCLIPEVPFKMKDVMDHVDSTLKRKEFMVIVVAEGAGREHLATGEADIGEHLRDDINRHLKPVGGRSFYIDPSLIIRSGRIDPNDHVYCARLSRDAVHTAMRGYTGVTVGPMHDILTIMPMNLVAGGKRQVPVRGSSWQSCLQVCNMPRSLSGMVAA